MERLRRLLFPVEGFFFLYVISTYFQMYFYQQYYFQYFAKLKLSSLPNYTAPSHQLCLAQDDVVNFTSNASFIVLQKKINHLNMYSNIISIGMSFIATVILGSLSDRLGRKPIVAIAIIGMIISSTMQTLVVYFNWNVYIFLVLLGIHGLTGGFPLTIGICFAIVTDTTPKTWLAFRMSCLEAAIGFGRAIASLGTNNWIHLTECSFFQPSLFCIGISIASFVYLLLIPETMPRRTNENLSENQIESIKISSKQYHHNDSRFLKLFNGLKIFFNPFYVGYSNWWRIWVLTAIICLACMCAVGGAEILSFFLHNKPLEWSYDKIGYYGAVSSTAMGLILIIFVPLLVLLKVSYPLIILIGIVSGIVGNIIVALVKTNWLMYIAGFFLSAQQIVYPVLRVLLEKHVYIADRGAIFTVSASFQMFASVFASILFNEIYQPEADVDGHLISASTVFWIMTGIWALCIPLTLCLLFLKQNPVKDADNEPLLVNDAESEPLLINQRSQ